MIHCIPSDCTYKSPAYMASPAPHTIVKILAARRDVLNYISSEAGFLNYADGGSIWHLHILNTDKKVLKGALAT
jgi:hypothetical protein